MLSEPRPLQDRIAEVEERQVKLSMCSIKHQAIKVYGKAEEEGHLSLINLPDGTEVPTALGSLCSIGNLIDFHVEWVG
jgi:hypothetical protein